MSEELQTEQESEEPQEPEEGNKPKRRGSAKFTRILHEGGREAVEAVKAQRDARKAEKIAFAEQQATREAAQFEALAREDQEKIDAARDQGISLAALFERQLRVERRVGTDADPIAQQYVINDALKRAEALEARQAQREQDAREIALAQQAQQHTQEVLKAHQRRLSEAGEQIKRNEEELAAARLKNKAQQSSQPQSDPEHVRLARMQARRAKEEAERAQERVDNAREIGGVLTEKLALNQRVATQEKRVSEFKEALQENDGDKTVRKDAARAEIKLQQLKKEQARLEKRLDGLRDKQEKLTNPDKDAPKGQGDNANISVVSKVLSAIKKPKPTKLETFQSDADSLRDGIAEKQLAMHVAEEAGQQPTSLAKKTLRSMQEKLSELEKRIAAELKREQKATASAAAKTAKKAEKNGVDAEMSEVGEVKVVVPESVQPSGIEVASAPQVKLSKGREHRGRAQQVATAREEIASGVADDDGAQLEKDRHWQEHLAREYSIGREAGELRR